MIWLILHDGKPIASVLSQDEAIEIVWEMMRSDLDALGNQRQPARWRAERVKG